MHPYAASLVLVLAAAAVAVPVQPASVAHLFRRQGAASMVLQIAPTSDSCTDVPEAGECATADEATPILIQAFDRYQLHDARQIAAVLALMAFETADFKYNRNHFPAPGRAGQGTRNMQMPNYNLAYALSVPALAAQAAAIAPAKTTAGLSDDQLNQILALVLPDQYSFASGAWFLATQCSASVRAALITDGDDGFAAYMGCVGAAATPDRLVYWNNAKKAIGLT